MKPYYQDNHIKIFNKDCQSMDELPDESVQCVITSPPYWGLRKYAGLPDLIWGGDKDCEHQWGELIPHPMHKSGGHTYASDISKGTQDIQDEVRHKGNLGCWCQLCGAWKGQYGLEPTPEMYIEHTLEFLQEIRRVLRKDGVVFWNIGDSYASQGGAVKSSIYDIMGGQKPAGYEQSRRITHQVIKPKDLCLIPFRLAIACQEDGWWVRSVIIWSKPNPMPESVTDRPTESHEYILMLTKSAKYYWDADAVREPHQNPLHSPGNVGGFENRVSGHRGEWGEFKDPDRVWGTEAGRNIRSVWEFPTQPYPEAHFAVFPEKLPEICIKAATPEVGCCSKCGAPWERIRENIGKVKQGWGIQTKIPPESGGHEGLRTKMINQFETLSWQPACSCNADKVPSLVLDPFAGTGTVGWVAKKLNRRCVMYELSEEYCELAVERNRQGALGL